MASLQEKLRSLIAMPIARVARAPPANKQFAAIRAIHPPVRRPNQLGVERELQYRAAIVDDDVLLQE